MHILINLKIYMKSKFSISLLIAVIGCCFQNCKSNEDIPGDPEKPVSTTLTVRELPIIDGSDSTEPLRNILVSKLLGCEYEWLRNTPVINYLGLRKVNINCSTYELSSKVINSNTHPSFVNLIDGKVDIIITARGISRDEAKYAEEKGVKLLQKPIARDGLAFIVNAENPVKNLTHQQIKDIYLKRITNWKEVGGEDAPITPYIRNANSGSQEKFETIVMDQEEIGQMEILKLEAGNLMWSPYHQLYDNKHGIAFSPYYYYRYIVDWEKVKTIGVNGIEPDKESLTGRNTPSSIDPAQKTLYPFATEVIVAVREDCPKDSQAYKIYEMLSTKQGQDIVEESGYVRYYSDK